MDSDRSELSFFVTIFRNIHHLSDFFSLSIQGRLPVRKMHCVAVFAENQIMSDDEQDLPDDIVPLPPPPDRLVCIA